MHKIACCSTNAENIPCYIINKSLHEPEKRERLGRSGPSRFGVMAVVEGSERKIATVYMPEQFRRGNFYLLRKVSMANETITLWAFNGMYHPNNRSGDTYAIQCNSECISIPQQIGFQ